MNCKEKQRREEYYMTSLEEGIEEKDVVRVIDEIINKLDLKKLGYKEKIMQDVKDIQKKKC